MKLFTWPWRKRAEPTPDKRAEQKPDKPPEAIPGVGNSHDLVWVRSVFGAVLVALLVLAGAQLHYLGDWGGVFATATLLAFACFACGCLLGFLFGIPKQNNKGVAAAAVPAPGAPPGGGTAVAATAADTTAATAGAATAVAARTQFRFNNNLEEISDWLTKTFVGVGLTQINSIGEHFKKVVVYFQPELGSGPQVAAAIVFFAVAGLVFGYLWTTLFYAGALTRAEQANNETAALRQDILQVKNKQDEQSRQSAQDATALSHVYTFLDRKSPSSVYPVEDLKKEIAASSPSAQAQILFTAYKVRSENWDKDKLLMARTIPVYEGLIQADPNKHAHHGELGFALKDKPEPDWNGAIAELSRAIELRGDCRMRGRVTYEFNRAWCRIKVNQGKATTPENKAAIIADLKAAASRWGHAFEQPTITEWLAANSVSMAEIKPPEESSPTPA